MTKRSNQIHLAPAEEELDNEEKRTWDKHSGIKEMAEKSDTSDSKSQAPLPSESMIWENALLCTLFFDL